MSLMSAASTSTSDGMNASSFNVPTNVTAEGNGRGKKLIFLIPTYYVQYSY